ncbi:ornithine cyclodeaminase [Thermosporothrix hazakensis]|jgi:ornithine cyclodeaminase|uniref:Ornithine cyclodeaminase n=1 Tax=Thermosporothrix hazakensis TaxID=644383 RepID=A0A326TZE9_THEHA|nr:ornithine cyclodeaminase family protein [Thermosporothrix hazakensis]PZW22854.1 ornithine cyclodeaminase [Thermosporothrix hazakensis]GCE49821.1 ornithine cyclodeaminase [Thermosporothrix hazakensis]
MRDGFVYLSRKDVMRACADLDSVAVMREVFQLHGRGQTILPDEAYLGWVNEEGEHVRSLNMPAYVGGAIRFAGTKVINGNIANPQRRGIPRASGLTLLYDEVTAQVVCVMEAAYLSSLRTASVSILSALLLQGGLIETVAVIGAGVIAQRHLELVLKYLPDVQRLLVYDLVPGQVEQVRQALQSELLRRGVTLEEAKSAEAAIRPAQLVIPATTVTEGYIQYAWLQPGTIVVHVSLDDVLPEVVLRADGVIVDDWELVRTDTRRLLGRMYRNGQLVGPDEALPAKGEECRRVDAQLGELVCGKRGGRKTKDDILLVNPFGLAIEDVALASYVYRKAGQLGLGIQLLY